MNSRRWKRLTVLLGLAAVVGVTLFLVARPRNDPRILNKVPPGMNFVPRSSFMTKPWIDMPWFGGGRLTYPSRATIPKGFKDDPNMSGYFTWDVPASPVIPPGAGSSMGIIFVLYFALGVWTDDRGEVFEAPPPDVLRSGYTGASPKEYAPLAYVYGNEPRKFTVAWPDALSALKMTAGGMPATQTMGIELPPNHRPAPGLPEQRIQAGKWIILLKPRLQLGPTFLPRYDVSVEGGGPKDTFFLAFSSSTSLPSIGHSYLRVSKGRTALLTGFALPSLMTVRIDRVESDSIRLTVRSSKPASARNWIEFKTDDGQVVAQGVSLAPGECIFVDNSAPGIGKKPKYLTVSFGPVWAGPNFSQGGTIFSSLLTQRRSLPAKPGQVFRAVGFKSAESATAKFALGTTASEKQPNPPNGRA